MCNSKSKIFAPLCMAISLLSIVASVGAHENHAHKAEVPMPAPTGQESEILAQINSQYLKEVKPIFRKSCFDCHSSSTRYPWYAKLPGAKQLIESDVNESKVHLDLSNDFPFGGHGTPNEDLEAIAEVIKEGSMPPFRYRILHSDSKLSNDEKEAIQNWVKLSLKTLGDSQSTSGHHGH